MNSSLTYTPQDYKSDQYVRWCPGCGDYAVLNSIHKAMAATGIPPHQMAVISGIGCSSRLPYYVNTYGFHTIHGRGAAIATGVKTARPDLSVWLVTGDGDCLAIGGNHFIHAVRRNVDLNIVMMNNKIYGLTKGQYSPTSDRGFITKSSPYGTVEDPFIPAELTLGARGTFFARAMDKDISNLTDVLIASTCHKGTSVVEVLVNCVIFNDDTHKQISDKAFRDERTIILRHGEKMLFGKEREKGLVLEGLKLKAVTIGQGSYTLDDILVHDAHEKDNTLHLMLAMMKDDLPVAMGVIREVKVPAYDTSVATQIAEIQAKQPGLKLQDFLMSGEVWEIK
ncbi:MAG: 2-oxoacid:ferredoxin oxidoreductase subunit beta [Tannerella sp.]|jgi:2-oxoglutarate ferredoxin oxidoreductase subunit beta|nr:2-oxoacid:ferredoxin oxidoreductase subunit beta [Tannerella sp.]